MNLTQLIENWKNSALEFREAEALINLLIIDNKRLETELNIAYGWHEVVKHCEEIFKTDDTAESPLMSNLPNLVRNALIDKRIL